MGRLIWWPVFAVALSAHEIGTTRVTAAFPGDGSYQVEIAADASSLAEKFGPVADNVTAAQLAQLLPALESRFRKRVHLAFDGVECTPSISFTVTPAVNAASAILATIRLTGVAPAGARAFTWKYGWTFATYSFTRVLAGGPAATDWLEGGDASRAYSLHEAVTLQSRFTTAWRYFGLGFTHILPFGLDHLLFVLGLYLLSSRFSAVLWQASAFTLAHSLTLGLSLYGLVSVSPSIVEPLIALSIAYVAVENIVLSELKKWRVGLIFAFGLLHGLGFAGALREVGMPAGDFATALVTFNLGVEAGQFAVILAAFLLVGWRFSDRVWYRARIAVPASAAIACMAFYWTIERTIL